MKSFLLFRSPLFAACMAAVLLFSSCSQNEVNDEIQSKTTKTDLIQKTTPEFLRFSVDDYKNYHQLGYAKIDGKVVLFDLDIKNGLTYDSILKTNASSFIIKNINGKNFDLSIQLNKKVSENKTYIVTNTTGYSHTMVIDGLVNADDFINQVNNNGGLIPSNGNGTTLKICPPCIVVIVAIVAGGIICGNRQASASADCLSAYNACLNNNNGAGCSYNFESTKCGGNCSIMVVGPLELGIAPMPRI